MEAAALAPAGLPMPGAGQSLDYGFANVPDLNVNGGAPFDKPLFEQAGQETSLNFSPANGGEHSLLAMDPGEGFGSTIGPNSGQAVDPQSLPVSQTNIPANQLPANQYSNMQDAQSGAGLERGASGQAAEGQVDSGQGTSGQSLDANGNPINDQPASGVDAKADTPATTSYKVKEGDNLWNISKDNLGGGEHWKDLYSNNTDVVGSNPNMLHPGQHLNMNGAGHSAAGGHLAAHHGATTHSGTNHSGTTHGASHVTSNGDRALSSNLSKPTISHAASGLEAKAIDGAKVGAAPLELKAVAKSLPQIEIYKDGAATSFADLGT